MQCALLSSLTVRRGPVTNEGYRPDSDDDDDERGGDTTTIPPTTITYNNNDNNNNMSQSGHAKVNLDDMRANLDGVLLLQQQMVQSMGLMQQQHQQVYQMQQQLQLQHQQINRDRLSLTQYHSSHSESKSHSTREPHLQQHHSAAASSSSTHLHQQAAYYNSVTSYPGTPLSPTSHMAMMHMTSPNLQSLKSIPATIPTTHAVVADAISLGDASTAIVSSSSQPGRSTNEKKKRKVEATDDDESLTNAVLHEAFTFQGQMTAVAGIGTIGQLTCKHSDQSRELIKTLKAAILGDTAGLLVCLSWSNRATQGHRHATPLLHFGPQSVYLSFRSEDLPTVDWTPISVRVFLKHTTLSLTDSVLVPMWLFRMVKPKSVDPNLFPRCEVPNALSSPNLLHVMEHDNNINNGQEICSPPTDAFRHVSAGESMLLGHQGQAAGSPTYHEDQVMQDPALSQLRSPMEHIPDMGLQQLQVHDMAHDSNTAQ